MASVVATKDSPLSISRALEELEFKYTTPPEDMEPCIKFLSSSPPKGQCLQRLRQIFLSGNQISEPGDLKQVAKTLKNARSIDLSQNNLQNWSIIGDLLSVIPTLRQIDLSFNPLDPQIDISTIPADNELETLIINGVELSLQKLASLLNALPRLKVLHICRTPLQLSDKENISNKSDFKFDQLTDLYMDDCNLNSWSDVLFYANKFPSLQRFYLSENNFDEIFDTCDQTNLKIGDALNNVTTLSMNDSAITDWKSIEVLGSLTNLKHLRIREAPLFDQYDSDTRHQLTVPRIPSIESLNGSLISKRYREDCERYFIRYYQNRDDKPLKIYNDLVSIHGNLEQLVCIDLSPQKYCRVRLRCDNTSMLIKIRLNITIRTFISIVSKATKIPLKDLRVLHVTPQYPTHCPTELRPSSQFLHTLKLEDTDEFRVFTKNVPSDVSHL